jgi:hypothetical protein
MSSVTIAMAIHCFGLSDQRNFAESKMCEREGKGAGREIKG